MATLFPAWLSERIVYIIGALLGLSIIGFLLRLYFKAHEKKESKKLVAEVKNATLPPGKLILVETPQPSHDHQTLIEFIQLHKQHGTPSAEIRQMLEKEGWLEEVLDVYLG